MYCTATEIFSRRLVTSCLTRHLDMPNTRLLWMAPSFVLHLTLHLRMDAPFMPLPHTHALCRRKPRALISPPRTRSPTLPLDEDEKFIFRPGTAGHVHQTSAASKATTLRLQKGKSKDRPVLKPVPSRISKQSPNERSLRHRIPKQQHQAKCLDKKPEDSPKKRQDEPQDSNFTSSATLPPHQADQPGNLNNQPISPSRKAQLHRASNLPHLESAQRATRRRTRVPRSKLSTKVNAKPLPSSTVHKTRRRNQAQEARHPKQQNTQPSPREHKTLRGRVSKRPGRLGFTS